jgi:hypothetical protein
MSVSNDNKAAKLGVSIGTAGGRLRKALLFTFAQRLGLDVCYRCGVTLETVDDFTIDHKQSWLLAADPVASFYDLSNIAFSHPSCNMAAADHKVNPGMVKYRKVGPDGTAWCGTCQKFLPTDQFTGHAGRWNGTESRCQACRSVINGRRNRRRVKPLPA